METDEDTRFDYTEWRKDQPFMDMPLDELSNAAMLERKARRSQQERPSQ